MRRPTSARRAAQEEFDAFYRHVRAPLLLQTFALTGDRQAAQKAVRDAFVVAWHHWRKVARLDDAEAWVRRLAWRRAQRRSTARWWSRQRDLDPDARATLDALAKLGSARRRTLLLVNLTSQPFDAIAREVGVGRATAERELQTATAQFGVHREVDSAAIRPLVAGLATELTDVRWPRSSILVRAGSARRRSHTTVGMAAAVAALVVSGSLVTDAAGVRPDLSARGVVDSPRSSRPHAHQQPTPEPELTTADVLLAAANVRADLPAPWTQQAVTDARRFTCADAAADPQGLTVVQRSFTAAQRHGRRWLGQSVEESRTGAAARRAFRTTRRWYAACADGRVQLETTSTVTGVGDEGTLFTLRDWDTSRRLVVAVARTGRLTTTVMTTAPVTNATHLPGVALLLAHAVDGLCGLPRGGACSTGSQVRPTALLPAGPHPAMLGAVDLPPVSRVSRPWVGTPPKRAHTNIAATQCDHADFSTAAFAHAWTRSFVIPAAPQLPAEFGLTQTLGALPASAAHDFIDTIRHKLVGCADRNLGVTTEPLAEHDTHTRELSAWRLAVKVSDKRSVRFLMAVIRTGTAVSQLTFVPSGDVQMSTDDFLALAARAQDRLAALPSPLR